MTLYSIPDLPEKEPGLRVEFARNKLGLQERGFICG